MTCRICHDTGVVTDWVDYGSTRIPMDSSCDCEAGIQNATLTLPDDLLEMRATLDAGENLTRSDCYALLNYIERRGAA